MNPIRNLRALLAALLLSAPVAEVAVLAQDTPPAPAPAKEAPAKPAEETFLDLTPDPADPPKAPKRHKHHATEPVVSIGSSESIPAGKSVDELVVIMGDAEVDGDIEGDVVVIGGRLKINGKVGGDAVNVGLGVELGPKAVVDGDVVGVGVGVHREEGSLVHGEVVPVGLGFLPGWKQGIPTWITSYFTDCVLKLRPLSFSVSWPWGVFGALFALHFLVAALLPGASRGVEKAMTERPGTTALMAVLAIPLGLFALVLLSITGIGPLVLIAASLVAVLIGKVAVAQMLGGRIAELITSMRPSSLVSFLIGSLLIALLYVTPYIGFFVWFALSLWGFSAVLICLFRRDNKPVPATTPSAPHTPPVEPTPVYVRTEPLTPAFAAATPTPQPSEQPPALDPGLATFAAAGAGAGAGTASAIPQEPKTSWAKTASLPGLDASEIESLPRPTFAPRFGALVLDWILISFVAALVPDRLFFINLDSIEGPLRVVLAVAYYAGMIAWRGTSLGGLLFGLQVVRLDSRPLDRATAIVRAVSAILSAVVAGLGWLWAFWDADKQAWHDKFAGTVVVRLPKSKPLV